MCDLKQDYVEDLRRISADAGVATFGVASMERMLEADAPKPAAKLKRFRYGISIGFRLSDALMETLVDGPNRQYAYHYRAVNRHLDQAVLLLTAKIQEHGYAAYPVPASQIIDWDENTGELSHIWVAYNAGLGWYGRNNLIIHPRWGARLRYATVLTDMPLPAGEPIARDCGDCYNCLNVCPAGAIGKSRAEYDLEKCRIQLCNFRNKRNIGHYICGICIKACPGTAHSGEKSDEN